MLQEAALTDEEAHTVTLSLDRAGFRSFYTPGASSRDRWGRLQRRGGLFTAVRRGLPLPSRKLAEHKEDEFQFQVMSVGSWTVVNYYTSLHDRTLTSARLLPFMKFSFRSSSAVGVAIGGDANSDTADSEFAEHIKTHVGSLAPGTRQQSSRWNSETPRARWAGAKPPRAYQ